VAEPRRDLRTDDAVCHRRHGRDAAGDGEAAAPPADPLRSGGFQRPDPGGSGSSPRAARDD
jgi:hypothetical protein